MRREASSLAAVNGGPGENQHRLATIYGSSYARIMKPGGQTASAGTLVVSTASRRAAKKHLGGVFEQIGQGLRPPGSSIAEAGGRRADAPEARRLPPLKAYLRAWQSWRLSRTYADLLASAEQGNAARFFLTNLYAPQDFSKRGADIHRAIDILKRALPESMIHGLLKAIELNDLSSTLDDALHEVMEKRLLLVDSFTL
jgi:hypothetical protein